MSHDFYRLPPDGSGKRLLATNVVVLQYDQCVIQFAINDVVTGATSGATGIVLNVYPTSNVVGELLISKDGGGDPFVDNEALQVGLSTKAVVNGTPVLIYVPSYQIVGSNPANIQAIDQAGASSIRFTEGQPTMDSFHNLKVSNAQVVGVYEHTVDAYDDLFYTELAGGATSVYDSARRCVVLTTQAASNSKAVRTTNRYHYYQGGVSLFIILTSSSSDFGITNNVRQTGYFDDRNGWLFEMSGGTFWVVQRSDRTGSVVDERVPYTEWNGDRSALQGSGLDPTLPATRWISIIHPAGKVRMGAFNASGDRVTLHTFENSSTTASLPVRFAMFNTGLASGSGDLLEYSATVMSNGDPTYTFWRYGSLGNATPTAVTTNTPVASFRSKLLLPSGARNTINVFPENLSVFLSAGAARIDVVSHASSSNLLTGATWAAADGGSQVEVDDTATAIDTADPDYWSMKSYMVGAGVTSIPIGEMFELNDEGILLAGDGVTKGTISLVATAISGTPDMTISMSTRELW